MIEDSKDLQWTDKALIKVKDSLECKYSFDNVCEALLLKGIGLKSFKAHANNYPFDRKQYLPGLVDNLRSRLITDQESALLEQFATLCHKR